MAEGARALLPQPLGGNPAFQLHTGSTNVAGAFWPGTCVLAGDVCQGVQRGTGSQHRDPHGSPMLSKGQKHGRTWLSAFTGGRQGRATGDRAAGAALRGRRGREKGITRKQAASG